MCDKISTEKMAMEARVATEIALIQLGEQTLLARQKREKAAAERAQLDAEYRETVRWFLLSANNTRKRHEAAEKFQAAVRLVNVLKDELKTAKAELKKNDEEDADVFAKGDSSDEEEDDLDLIISMLRDMARNQALMTSDMNIISNKIVRLQRSNRCLYFTSGVLLTVSMLLSSLFCLATPLVQND
jgi:hypothetical protein